MDSVVLRYFSCRGRAQPLRDALTDAGCAFTDVVVMDWRTRAQPRDVAGPFASLPTLSWGDVHACETLPIARLVADRLGHTRGLSESHVLELEAMCSAMYLDVMVPVSHAIWSDFLFPGADPKGVTARQLPRWVSKLRHAVALLPDDRPFLGGDAPVVADFFLYEAFDAVATLIGPRFAPRLEREVPRLGRLVRDVRVRPRLAQIESQRQPRFTGRRDEPEVLRRLHACEPAELWPGGE